MKRIAIYFLLFVGVLLAASRPVLGVPPGRCPNLIFILADDLGYGDLGCFGQQYIKTPNLDRLCAEGLKLTSHYAGSTVCAPSRSVPSGRSTKVESVCPQSPGGLEQSRKAR
jgi:hypothetical protein